MLRFYARTTGVVLLGLVAAVGTVAAAIALVRHNEPKTGQPQTPAPSFMLPEGFTLHDKIGQLLVVGVTSTKTAEELERQYQIGGFLLETGADIFTKQATDAVKRAGKIPPLFAIDQEGGKVSRLPDMTFRQFTAARMGSMPDAQVRDIAESMGRRLAAIGVTNNLAPVVDLDNGHNASISLFKRAFSSDPAVVTKKAEAFADGLRQAGIVPTFKHFPGLGKATGVTRGNTDDGPATTPHLDVLMHSDLLPYRSVLASEAPTTVMVGNQIVPGLTNGQPASLSRNAYDLLRSTFNFKQVVFTDELFRAGAIANTQPSPAAAVIAALQAGADMPLIDPDSPQDVAAIIDAVARAVKSGQLKESQIDASLGRIMQLKDSLK